jgi:hypothetical protein
MMRMICRWIGFLLALPFVPLAYALAMVSRPKPAAVPPSPGALATMAFEVLRHEREIRGLEPLACDKIQISYGDFDEIRITFESQSLADGASDGLRLMGQLGNFALTPKIGRDVEMSQARARVRAFKAGLTNG